jgi:serine/threonine-protein phosphatase 2A regulatory subunit B'
LRYWPVTNPSKEIILLNEIEEIVELMSPEQLLSDDSISPYGQKPLALLIIEKLNRCMKSEHYQVAERALLMWNNSKMKWLLKESPISAEISLVIIDSLMFNAKHHWNK